MKYQLKTMKEKVITFAVLEFVGKVITFAVLEFVGFGSLFILGLISRGLGNLFGNDPSLTFNTLGIQEVMNSGLIGQWNSLFRITDLPDLVVSLALLTIFTVWSVSCFQECFLEKKKGVKK